MQKSWTVILLGPLFSKHNDKWIKLNWLPMKWVLTTEINFDEIVYTREDVKFDFAFEFTSLKNPSKPKALSLEEIEDYIQVQL